MTTGDEQLEGIVALLRDLGCGPVPESMASTKHELWVEAVTARAASMRTRVDLGLPCTCVLCQKKDEPAKQATNTSLPVATGVVSIPTAMPCRFCHKAAYARDPDGPLHPCCFSWAEHIAQTGRCPACMVAKLARQTWSAQQQRRAPRLPPPPPTR